MFLYMEVKGVKGIMGRSLTVAFLRVFVMVMLGITITRFREHDEGLVGRCLASKPSMRGCLRSLGLDF